MTHQLRLRIGIALAAAIAALIAGMGVAANAAIDSHVLAIHRSGGHSTPRPQHPSRRLRRMREAARITGR